jgi:hypothetical protein
MGKLRMDCRTRAVPPLSCISKKLWIWTFLTYPQSQQADITSWSSKKMWIWTFLTYPQSRLADITSWSSKEMWIWTFLTYPQIHLADIPPDRPNNYGFGISSPTFKFI